MIKTKKVSYLNADVIRTETTTKTNEYVTTFWFHDVMEILIHNANGYYKGNVFYYIKENRISNNFLKNCERNVVKYYLKDIIDFSKESFTKRNGL